MPLYSRRTTLADVARTAGVSEMTVSRVLRNSGIVSTRTRDKVNATVEKLGYVQNKLAGSLATARSNQVAVVIPSLMNNVFTEVVAGIADELDKAGYAAIIGVSDYNLEKEETLITSMMSWRPAGVIVPNVVHTERTRNILLNGGVPVVEMMSLTRTPIDMSVGIDQADAGRMLARHLLSRGYRRFGYVGWHAQDHSAAERLAGIEAMIEAAGAILVKPDMFNLPPDISAGKRGLQQLLATAPDVEVAMFSNDTAATGGYLYCIEAGIDVPDQLALAGFSGLQTGQNMPRKLTTILTHRYEIGRISARSILNRLEGREVPTSNEMRFSLIEGETA